jgi:hypothetical protein
MPVVTRDMVDQPTNSSAVTDDLWRSPEWRRVLQLALAAIWMLDGLLQLQPFFFTAGNKGFSGMLAGAAAGNPRWVAHSISWNASLIGHHPQPTNAAFAAIQILLGLGIAWRPTVKVALGTSIAWSVAVWWFGEGLGAIFQGGAGSPLNGGPGAVLFYALLAVLLWPTEPSSSPSHFAATAAIGEKAATVIWIVVWFVMAALMVGAGHGSESAHDVIAANLPGEPGWLATLDHHALSLVDHRGLTVAIVFALVFVGVGVSVLLPRRVARAGVVIAVIAAIVIWVVGENFGLIFPGGATDPNSGPLLVLLAATYWPLRPQPAESGSPGTVVPTEQPLPVGAR